MTEARLGEGSNANEAGNLVLGDVAPYGDHRPRSAPTIQPADQERGGGTARQRGKSGAGAPQGSIEAPVGSYREGHARHYLPGGKQLSLPPPLAPDISCHVI